MQGIDLILSQCFHQLRETQQDMFQMVLAQQFVDDTSWVIGNHPAASAGTQE